MNLNKNVGLMFFSLEPDKFMPYAQIDVVEFPEGVGGDRIIEKIFKGPLHQQLREALLYIKNSVIKEQIIKYPDRAEADRFYNYPYAAIEEALANAVYHKAYDVREPIEVRVEADRIEILSFPGPDRSVTREGLKTYRVTNRRYRNRRIGEFLKELHLTEGRNTGFRKILNALERNGTNQKMNELAEQKVLLLLQDNGKITQKMIEERAGIPLRTVKRIMSELQKQGRIFRIGSSRSGEWHVQK